MTGVFSIASLFFSFVFYYLALIRYDFGFPGMLLNGIIFAFCFGLVGHSFDKVRRQLRAERLDNQISGNIESAAATESVPYTYPQRTGPYGFGGWLILFALGMIRQLYLHITSVYNNYITLRMADFQLLVDSSNDYYSPLWLPTVYFETIIEALIAVFIIIMVFMCIKHRKQFKYLAIAVIIISAVFTYLDLALVLRITNGFADEVFQGTNIYEGVLKSTLYAVVWLPYFLLSKRVKNTYTS
ncbi:hypothetical protein D3C75_254670 [compost metagenome]